MKKYSILIALFASICAPLTAQAITQEEYENTVRMMNRDMLHLKQLELELKQLQLKKQTEELKNLENQNNNTNNKEFFAAKSMIIAGGVMLTSGLSLLLLRTSF